MCVFVSFLKVYMREEMRNRKFSWYGLSVRERQRSRLCNQNLRVPFLRTVLPPEVGESARAMASTARQKRSYLHHQGEFQHQNCTVGTTGPQLPNCQTQCHFSWLVVSPLRPKSTRSGNLVLAGILAFLCRQNRFPIPP